jgi:hypothetical protein
LGIAGEADERVDLGKGARAGRAARGDGAREVERVESDLGATAARFGGQRPGARVRTVVDADDAGAAAPQLTHHGRAEIGGDPGDHDHRGLHRGGLSSHAVIRVGPATEWRSAKWFTA